MYEKNLKYYITIAILVVIVLAGGFYFFSTSQKFKQDANASSKSATSTLRNLLGENNQNKQMNQPTTESQSQEPKSYDVTIETNKGNITFTTYNKDAPLAVKNFITLAEKGFYDNLTFHRIIKGFMIQGGDPKGDGTGGPGYTFADELNPETESYKNGYKKGVVAMANSGPNTNGSQFFIMLADNPLPHNYTIFGKVIQGQDVVDAIGSVKTGTGDKPIEPVVMKKVTVEAVQ